MKIDSDFIVDESELTRQQYRELFWKATKREAFRKRNYPQRIAAFQPVEGVTYRTSPTTGLQRAVKPSPR